MVVLQWRALESAIRGFLMQRLRSFILLTLLGGVAVILPLLLFILLARWVLGLLRNLALPLAIPLGERIEANEPLSIALVLAALLLLCFVIGLAVRTRIGAWLHEHIDEWLSRIAPGYRMVRDTVGQLIGAREPGNLRGDVALVRLYGAQSAVLQVAIVTSQHADGSFTVYVPTAPLPTQGFVFHLQPECVLVQPDISFEAAMRMVLACGAGAGELLGSRLSVAARSGQ
jgi:uncharacterized membrane protein